MAVARTQAFLSPETPTNLAPSHRYSLACTTTAPQAGGVATVCYKVRETGTTWNKLIAVGDVWNVDGDIVEAVWLDPATLTINIGAVVTIDDGWVLAVGSPNGSNQAGPVTVGPSGTFGPSVIAAATVETVETSIGGLVPGMIVHYELDGAGIVAADAAALIYIAIKGASSGIYYALARGSPVAASFVAVTTETLQIVVRNAGTTGYQMHAYVEARIGASS